MGIAQYPAASSGGGLKSVQRGSAAGSGNVTITAVDTSKAFVTIFGTASSGTVSSSATLSGTANLNARIIAPRQSIPNTGQYTALYNTTQWEAQVANNSASGNVTNSSIISLGFPGSSTDLSNISLTGGSNNLVAAVVQGYLSNSTTLVVSGACRWQVVEFN